jgi:D-arabinose 1-dehydrogenase-like Zn-dependent alcohol dehydrogenase
MAPIEFTVFKASSSGAIKQDTTTKEDLTKDQVLVKITHSGVCFTDVHYRNTDIVLGHEGVGIVERVGPDVKTYRMCVLLVVFLIYV